MLQWSQVQVVILVKYFSAQRDHDGKLVIYLTSGGFEKLLNCFYRGEINFNTTNIRRIIYTLIVSIKFQANELRNLKQLMN